MSSPGHDTEKEARRHLPALVGIAVALGVAAVLIVVVLILPRLPADEQATPVPAPDGAAIDAGEDDE